MPTEVMNSRLHATPLGQGRVAVHFPSDLHGTRLEIPTLRRSRREVHLCQKVENFDIMNETKMIAYGVQSTD